MKTGSIQIKRRPTVSSCGVISSMTLLFLDANSLIFCARTDDVGINTNRANKTIKGIFIKIFTRNVHVNCF